MSADEPTVSEVKAAIAKLPREDRAMLRPWLLAHYDVRRYRQQGYAAPPPERPVSDAGLK
jgi:hypothetical protein